MIPVVVVHAFNPNNREAEAGGSQSSIEVYRASSRSTQRNLVFKKKKERKRNKKRKKNERLKNINK